jgi:ABC-type transporter Mla MlaB component
MIGLDARSGELGSLRLRRRYDFAAGESAAQPRERDMLRITVTETAVEERWTLQGRLTKRSVAELVSSWRASVGQPPARCRIVDLNEVTSIDKSGEEALLMMVRDGATFVASGVYTKHLLDQLQARQTNQQHLD